LSFTRYRAPEVLLQSCIYSSKVGKCLMLNIMPSIIFDNLFLATMMMSIMLLLHSSINLIFHL